MRCGAAVPSVTTQRGLLPTPPPQLRHPLQISSKEEPRHYSAKIAWNARNNSHMPLLATGAPAINCAIKVREAGAFGCGVANAPTCTKARGNHNNQPCLQAVAIARRLLEEDSLELFVQPAFRDRWGLESLHSVGVRWAHVPWSMQHTERPLLLPRCHTPSHSTLLHACQCCFAEAWPTRLHCTSLPSPSGQRKGSYRMWVAWANGSHLVILSWL